MSNSISRRRDYDLLRAVSMAAVVYLHTAASNLQIPAESALWQLSNWGAALFSAAVPLFFMLSGALLLRSERTADPAFVLKYRLPKILLPALFWSGVIIAGTWYLEGGARAFDMLVHLPSTTVLTSYWFIYALVPMYLLAPLLKRMADHLEAAHWKYLLLLWWVLTLGRQTVAYLVPEPWKYLFIENSTLTVSVIGGYLGYFLLGLYLARLKKLPKRRTLWLVAAADWALMALTTWYTSMQYGYYNQQFLDYRGLFAAVLATCIFLLARSCCGGKESGRVLTALAGCSFGVYLAHPFAIKVVEYLFPVGGIPGQLLTWLLALAGSILGVVVVQSIKPLCYLVTGQKFSAACKESNLFALFRRGD